MSTYLHGLPVFIADIQEDEECGIDRVSLVHSPAVESDFLAFREEERPLRFAVNDEERRHVLGVIMRANYPIYRNDGGQEYFIMYRPEAIERMAEKYLREGRSSYVNIEHRDGSDVDGVDMIQWFIKNSASGIAPAGFEDIEDGSLFAEYHITNDEVWAKVKDGTFRGFSLQGLFSVTPSDGIPSDEKMPKDLLDRLATDFTNISLRDMKILEQVRAALAAIASVKMGSATTQEGVIYWDGDAELAVGDAVYVDSEDGERTAAPDGDYHFEDGHTVTVAGGKVTAITEAVEAPVEDGATETEEAAGEEPAATVIIDEDARQAIEAINARLDDMEAAIGALTNAVKTIAEGFSRTEVKPAHEEFTGAGTTEGETYADRMRQAKAVMNK